MSLRVLALLSVPALLSGTRAGPSRADAPTRAPEPPGTSVVAPAPPSRRCPAEMVDVGGRFCVDRWEIGLDDDATGRRLSPYYHPDPKLARRDLERFRRLAPRTGPQAARQIPLPALAAWQLEPGVVPKAVSAPNRVPNAFLDLASARAACANAGKRLCRRDEWLTACRGERDEPFGYGDRHDEARCNLASAVHPASLLHGKEHLGLLDPRLNVVEHQGRALLRPTGTLLGCAAPWGDDAVYDMIGNLDEWIDDPAGTFLGGFYARDTRWGCDARIEVHSADYYDYSLGARCCL